MLKRSLVILLLALAIVCGHPTWPAYTIEMTEAEMAQLDASSAAAVQEAEMKTSGGGNRFVKILKAPFKAIGRLFGRGNKDNDNKLHRLSKKDVEKFESAKMTRIIDARSAPTAPTQTPEGVEISPLPGSTEATTDPNTALSYELLERGRQMVNKNDPNGAIMALSTAASLNPRLRDAHNLLGIAYEMKGMRRQALLELELALKGDDDSAEHLNNYGYLLTKNGDYNKAVKYLKRAVKLMPNEQRFLNNLAVAQAQAGKFEDAYESFERAVGPFDGHMNMAIRLQRIGKEKEAIKHLEIARGMQPNNLDILSRLVALYGQTSEPEKAAEASKSIVAIQASANATTQQ